MYNIIVCYNIHFCTNCLIFNNKHVFNVNILLNWPLMIHYQAMYTIPIFSNLYGNTYDVISYIVISLTVIFHRWNKSTYCKVYGLQNSHILFPFSRLIAELNGSLQEKKSFLSGCLCHTSYLYVKFQRDSSSSLSCALISVLYIIQIILIFTIITIISPRINMCYTYK